MSRYRVCWWMLIVAVIVTASAGCAAAVARGFAAGAVRGAGMGVARGLATGATRLAPGGRALIGAAGVGAAGVGGAGAAGALTGSLRGTLVELTSGGRLRPTLTIDKLGRIHHEGRYLATLESRGEIVVENGIAGRRLVGRVSDGQLWEVTSSGNLRVPVGQITGFAPGSGIRVRTGPGFTSQTIEVLHPGVGLQILQVKEGWFEIRLVDGVTGWVWAPWIAVSTVLSADDRDQSHSQRRNIASITLTDGRLLWVSRYEFAEGGLVTSLVTTDGKELVVDGSLIHKVEPVAGEWDWSSGLTKVFLRDGALLLASAYRVEREAAVIDLPSGDAVVVDLSMISDVFPALQQ